MMNKTEVSDLSRVREWDLNPRGGVYDEGKMVELVRSLEDVGLQDAIHVWRRVDGDYLLKGHRRFEAMRRLGWGVCEMVVHAFEDEREAYLYLLQDHGHTVPLDAWERCVAARNGVDLGMDVGVLSPALGVSEGRVQLWLDIESDLPQKGKNALADGRLSVHTAELLLQVPKEERVAATQMVLEDPLTKQPMAHAQAKSFVQATYIRPAEWLKRWEGMLPGLKKKFAMVDGFRIVKWEERKEWVQGETGQPWPDFEFGDGYIKGDAEGRRWMDKALGLGVEVLVVPAPLHEDKYVLLVDRRMLRAAEEGVVVPVDGLGQGGEDEQEEEDVGAIEEEDEDDDEGGVAGEEAEAELVARLGRVFEVITCDPAKVMVQGVWEPLLGPLVSMVARDSDLLMRWTRDATAAGVLDRLGRDKKHRGPLRWAFMLALVAAVQSGGAEPLAKVEGELGVG